MSYNQNIRARKQQVELLCRKYTTQQIVSRDMLVHAVVGFTVYNFSIAATFTVQHLSEEKQSLFSNFPMCA